MSSYEVGIDSAWRIDHLVSSMRRTTYPVRMVLVLGSRRFMTGVEAGGREPSLWYWEPIDHALATPFTPGFASLQQALKDAARDQSARNYSDS